jgi:hypothetical protein
MSMDDRRMTVQLPLSVAHEAIEAGIALPVPTTRMAPPLADILITGLSVITTVITLAQGPTALTDIAHRLAAWRHHASLTQDPTVSVEASGPRGRVSIRLTKSTTPDEIAQVMSLVLDQADKAVGHQITRPEEESPPSS